VHVLLTHLGGAIRNRETGHLSIVWQQEHSQSG